MKPSFHHRAVNGPFDDPSVYVRLMRQRRALLLDAGELTGLSPGDMLKVTDLFISHTHIDHFIGFDTLLRLLLGRPQPLCVYGPEGIIEQVNGKLQGYTWNLIEQYPLEVKVHAIGPEVVRRASFHAKGHFRLMEHPPEPYDTLIIDEPQMKVCAVILDHGTPSVAYCIEEPFHININKDLLQEEGLPIGPWLSRLKDAIRSGASDETQIQVDERTLSLSYLKKLCIITEGQKIAYATDAAPHEKNIKAITRLARNADTLYCEAYFLHEDLETARIRNHLTGRITGEIARAAGVKALVPMHCSPRYQNSDHDPAAEALRVFHDQ